MEKRDMKADSVLMHRERNIIAVRVVQNDQTAIQVFDMEQSKKVTQVVVPDTCVFWRWVNTNTIAVVGKNSVYHVDASSQQDPVKIFDRAPQMAQCQIMNYDIDEAKQWCFLVGLYSPD